MPASTTGATAAGERSSPTSARQQRVDVVEGRAPLAAVGVEAVGDPLERVRDPVEGVDERAVGVAGTAERVGRRLRSRRELLGFGAAGAKVLLGVAADEDPGLLGVVRLRAFRRPGSGRFRGLGEAGGRESEHPGLAAGVAPVVARVAANARPQRTEAGSGGSVDGGIGHGRLGRPGGQKRSHRARRRYRRNGDGMRMDARGDASRVVHYRRWPRGRPRPEERDLPTMSDASAPIAAPSPDATQQPTVALVAAALVVAASVIVAAGLALLVHHGVGFVRFDRRGLHLVRTHDTPLLVDAARALADLGTFQTLVVVAIVIGVVLRSLRLHPLLCVVPLASLLLTGAFVEMTKLAMPRSSPNPYFRWGVERGVGSSFPSGHAADATALAVGFAIVIGAVLLRRPAERVFVGTAAVAVSIAVGVSRLVLGVHWPTDVLAGWAIGLGTAVVVATVGVLATQRRPFVPALVDER